MSESERAEREIEEGRCPVCGGTAAIRDYQHNTLVCKECGRVLRERIKDRGPEWRAFDQEGREDKERAGPPTTQTFHDKGLSTQIDSRDRDGKGKKLSPDRRSQMGRLRKLHRRMKLSGSKDRNLTTAFSELSRLSSQLGLPNSVRESSAKTYREVVERGLVRGRSIEGMIVAVLYLECVKADVPRTFEEVAKVSSVDRKKVGRNYRHVLQELDVSPQLVNSANYIARFGSRLNLSGEARAQAVQIIRKVRGRGLTAGMSPRGIAAAAIYIACRKTGEERTQREAAEAADVTEVTLRNRYKEIAGELEKEGKGKVTYGKKTLAKELPQPGDVETEIENVVATVEYVGTSFDLEKLSKTLKGSEYDPDKFPGLSYHTEKPEASFLIFETGRANCVGAQSVEEMEKAVEKITRKIEGEEIKVDPDPKVEVQNIVAQVNFGTKLNIANIHKSSLPTSYGPETFPGLTIKLKETESDFLLFSNGQGVCHIKKMKDLERTIKEMIETLNQF